MNMFRLGILMGMLVSGFLVAMDGGPIDWQALERAQRVVESRAPSEASIKAQFELEKAAWLRALKKDIKENLKLGGRRWALEYSNDLLQKEQKANREWSKALKKGDYGRTDCLRAERQALRDKRRVYNEAWQEYYARKQAKS